MRIRILGSAAGGGFPQWNCACPNCRAVRAGTIGLRPRTQASVAISGDDQHWYVLGASPEIRAQIESFAPLHPQAPRHTPIAGVLLANGDLDHTLGLLSLREWSHLTLYATPAVRDAFCQHNVLNNALQRYPGHSQWLPLQPGESQSLLGGIQVEPVMAPGKPPLYAAPNDKVSDLKTNNDDVQPVWNVGFKFSQHGRTFGFFPSVAHVTPALRTVFDTVDLLFFDGTLWSETELVDLGLAQVRAADMAHLPVGGPNGSLQALASLHTPRRVFLHINNTNPMLREDSPEAASVRAAGWSIGEDGQEFVL